MVDLERLSLSRPRLERIGEVATGLRACRHRVALYYSASLASKVMGSAQPEEPIRNWCAFARRFI